MSGLVMEQMHAHNGANAAANQGKNKERGFRNTPGSFLGFILVHTHGDETCAIYNNKIYDDQCDCVHKYKNVLFLEYDTIITYITRKKKIFMGSQKF